MPQQALELSEAAAAAEAQSTVATLERLAQDCPERAGISHHRYWWPTARTYICHTCTEIPGQPIEALAAISDVFYRAATLASQPWYPEFQGGHSLASTARQHEGTLRQHRVSARFDLHVGKARCYRQLLSEHAPDTHSRVLVARSIDDPQGDVPLAGVLAYTLAPNGEVFEWQEGKLYWHHICTTPGARVLPGALDRWLINTLRRFRLDSAERGTYQREAELLRDWILGGAISAH